MIADTDNRFPGAVTIEEPFDGAILNRRHGQASAGGLKIRVSAAAPGSEELSINGRPARREGGKFVGEVLLERKVTEIVAAGGRGQDRVCVVWDRHSQPRYHFAVDDNIFFLRDIARENYASLFDCFYLKTVRDLHKRYGTRFSVNLLTHEQYFWPFYRAYVPDHAQRCEAAIRWATDHGYKPVFFHEGFLGGPE